jgi:hypothetical protein
MFNVDTHLNIALDTHPLPPKWADAVPAAQVQQAP